MILGGLRPARKLVRLALLSASCITAVGCVRLLDQEHIEIDDPPAPAAPPGIAPRATVLDECDYERNGEVLDAFSLAFSQGAHWMFFHSPSTPGPDVVSTSAAIASVAPLAESSPCDAMQPVTDGSGLLTPLLSLDDAETSFNAAHQGEQAVSLVPLSGVVHQDRGILFYRKLLRVGDGIPVILGIGVADVAFGEPAQRLVPAHYPDEPAMLWVYPQAYWGTGAVLHTDGKLYVYGCGWPINTCKVARVPPESVADVKAYEYYAGSQGWLAHLEVAVPVAVDTDQVSIAFNPSLGAYLQVSRASGLKGISSAVKAEPWGLPENERPLIDLQGRPLLGGAHQHPAYQSGDGTTLLVSYQWKRDGIRTLTLATVELD